MSLRPDRSRRARAAPRAPVTLATLPGRPSSVSRASQAKAIASTKSGSMPVRRGRFHRMPGSASAQRGHQRARCARRRRRRCTRAVRGCGRRAARRRCVRDAQAPAASPARPPPLRRRPVAIRPSRGGTGRDRWTSAAAARTRARRAGARASASSTRPCARERAVAIEALRRCGAGTRHPSGRCAGPVSKPRTASRTRRARQQGEIGDAAEVEHRAIFVGRRAAAPHATPAPAVRRGRRRRRRGGGSRRPCARRCARRSCSGRRAAG